MANYPTIVKKFQSHSDGTEYVRAAHVNDLQDELAAVENTLGIKPHIFTATGGATTSYASVAARLDTVQRSLTTQQTQINSLLDAAKSGWSLPIASLYASGTNIPATVNSADVKASDWHNVRWTSAVVDTDGAFAPGYWVTIPKRGWWIVTSTTTMKHATGNVNIVHDVWVRVRVDGVGSTVLAYEIGKDDSSAVEGENGWHRLTTASGVELYEGDRVYLQVRHDYIATDPATITKSTMSAASRIQLTYVRALPTGPTTRPATFYLPDELDPTNP